MRRNDVFQDKGLGSLRRKGVFPVGDLIDALAVVAQKDGLEAGRAGDGVALGLRGLDVLGDDIVGDEGPDAVMEQHDAVVGVLGLGLLQKIVDGILCAGTARDDVRHFREAVLFTEGLDVRDVVFEGGDVDLVDLRVPLEQTDRVDEDRHGVDLKELFRDTGTHTDAAAAGKDQSDIHKGILLFDCLVVSVLLLFLVVCFLTGRQGGEVQVT